MLAAAVAAADAAEALWAYVDFKMLSLGLDIYILRFIMYYDYSNKILFLFACIYLKKSASLYQNEWKLPQVLYQHSVNFGVV